MTCILSDVCAWLSRYMVCFVYYPRCVLYVLYLAFVAYDVLCILLDVHMTRLVYDLCRALYTLVYDMGMISMVCAVSRFTVPQLPKTQICR